MSLAIATIVIILAICALVASSCLHKQDEDDDEA